MNESKRLYLALFALTSGLAFGLWQHSFWAGLFVTTALAVLDQRS